MVKIKAKIKNGAIEAQVTPEKGDSFIDYELDHLKRLRCRGFFKPVKVKGKSLVYVGPQGFTLREKFAQPMSEVEVFRYIEQMLNTFRKLTVNKMNPNSLILNMDFVYINPSTDELQFLYLPTYSGGTGADGFGFLKDLLYSIPAPQPLPYIKEFESFLYTLSGFNWEQIEGYIKKKHPMVVKVITDSNYGQEGFPVVKPQPQPADPNPDPKTGPKKDPRKSGKSWIIEDGPINRMKGEEKTVSIDLEDATDIIDEGTVVMENTRAILHRCSDSTDYKITKNRSVIGRKTDCDYVINNNKHVSREHAEINQMGNSFYLKDCGARNGTFVNEDRMQEGTEQELHDGDVIKLADEKFIFRICR